MHPDPVRGDDAVRRLQRRGGALLAVRRRRGRLGGQRRRVVDRLRGRLLRPRRHPREARQEAAHQADAPAWADRWFERYGDGTVFFSRMLPIVRTFISLPAGVARMPFWRFTLLHRRGLHPVDLHARVHRQAGRRTTGRAGRTTCTTSTTRWSRLIVVGDRLSGVVRNRRRRAASRPPMRRAEVVALGLIQGPAELLPVSSSGHVAALPLLLGWGRRWARARRKEVEVALHAGGAVGLVVGLRRELMALPRRRAARWCRRRSRASWPSTGSRSASAAPCSLAAGLVAGSAALVVADRRPGLRLEADAGLPTACCSASRRRARWCRGSRERARRWRPRGRSGSLAPTPSRLSRRVGVPVLAGAAALKGARLHAAAAGPLGAGDPGAGRRVRGGGHARVDAARGVLERDRPLGP